LRTKLGVDAPPPTLIPPSGARTSPHLPRSDGSSAIVDQVSVADVLADLGHRPTVPTPAKGAPVMPTAPRSSGSSWLLMLLVLIVAGGAAAVVYFALPYFT
jgi:hypothetical protein